MQSLEVILSEISKVPLLLCVVLIRHAFLIIGAIADKISRRNTKAPWQPNSELPLVSVVIPAYNEERVICGAIESALQSDYPHLQVIVLDDGLIDGTYLNASNCAAEYDRAKVIKQTPNQGKPAALNAGIKCAKGDYFVALDADTVLALDCIRLLMSALIREE